MRELEEKGPGGEVVTPPLAPGWARGPGGEGRSLAEWFRLWRRLVGAVVRGQMQYRVSFIMQVLTQFGLCGLDFVALYLLLSRFEGLKGWALPEVALLYGIAAMSFGFAEMFSGVLDNFSSLMKRGDFDRYLTRPLPLMFQMMTAEFVLRRIGRIAQGFALLYAIQNLNIAWNAADWTLLALTIAGGILFWFAILICGATSCFWTAETSEVANIFSYGGIEMLSYPMSIYNEWFRKFFTFIIPMAFINYFPVLWLTRRADPIAPAWVAWLSPLVCVLVFLIALRIWNWGVKHYQSAGG